MAPLTITTLQTNLVWENKIANLDYLGKKINGLQEKTEIVVLPEMFSTGFCVHPQLFAETMEGETLQWMKEISADNKIILTGSLIIKENEQYYNRLIWMLPNGEFGYYDKRHLFGFAEEDKHYTAGNKRLIASVKGWKINLQICYDLRFPVWARNRITPIDPSMAEELQTSTDTRPEFDVLLYVANWPERRSHAWKTLLCARAIENQCYVVGVNRVGMDGNNVSHSGNSLVIDPLGEVLYHMADEEDIFTITLQKEWLNDIRRKYPFWKDADEFNFR
jgi:omega-amidase